MSGKMTRSAYAECITQDLDWLSKQPDSLEKRHIELVIKRSVDSEYPPSKATANYDFKEDKTK